jgi:DNA-binding HxlR family transcriptional regulator
MERTWMLDYDPANCAVGAAVAILGERPTFLVLREAFNGVRRFADMQRRTGIPRQVLSDRLAHLVQEGLLRKVPYRDSGQRSRHEYRLTAKGLDLYPVLVGLMQWGDTYAAGPDGPPVVLRHRDCGEPVHLQLACGAGHVLESARDVTPVPGPGARKIA